MKRTLGLLGVGATAVVVAAACSDVNNHLLEAQQYTPGTTCLGAPAVLDDVSGADPGQCAPTCLTVTAEGGPLVFVTTECAPYPPYYRPEGADATRGASDPCTEAFVVYADGSICPADAGPPVEAGAEGGAEAGDASDAGSRPADAGDGG